MADSEDEDEEEERGQSKEQRKLARQRSRAWLKEGGGDEPLNFLDPKVAQRVLGEQETADRGAQGGPALLLGSCRQGELWCVWVPREDGMSWLGLAYHHLMPIFFTSHPAWTQARQEEGPWLQGER